MSTVEEIIEKINSLENIIIMARIFKSKIQEVNCMKKIEELQKMADMKRLMKAFNFIKK